jgi:olfactory receptor
MYFFLSYLSFVDFFYSCTVAPEMLENIVAEDRAVSFTECVLQYYFFATFVVTEAFLLIAMSYDCLVAICNPLLYTVVPS